MNRNKSVLRRTFGLLVLSCLIAFSVSADDLDNVIFAGTVFDSVGAVVSGATVTLKHFATGRDHSVVTDAEGRYRIVSTRQGMFSLTISASGFREERSDAIEAAAGRTVTLNFLLTPAGVVAEVKVTASTDSTVIDTTRTVSGDTILRKEIDDLPILTRDPLELVFLLGGVTEAPLATDNLADEGSGVFVRGTPEEAGIFSLTGAQATSNNITIDGLDNNDDRSARERIALNPEAVAEVQVITNQYAAEYGRASGGRINLFTRAGGRDYHGEAYGYFGDESLNANTYFRNARGLGRVPQQRRREGLVFSGPILKKKHFFLTSYERLDVTDSTEIDTLVPVRSNPRFPLPAPDTPPTAGAEVGQLHEEISTPEVRNLVNGRFDLNLSQSHNASVRFDLARGGNRRGFPGGARLPETILVQGRDSYSIGASDYLVLGGRLVNQGRVQISSLLPRNKTDQPGIGVIIEEPARVVAGAFTGTDASPASAREENRVQIQDALSFTTGSHAVKLGGDLQLVRSSFTDLFAAGGQYTFESVTDFLDNKPSRFIQRFNTESRLANNVIGVFVQDEWRVKPGFTLSIGARWDSESIVDDRDNFSPRIAIAWDPFAERESTGFTSPGKTVVRAGYGIFYNRALLRTIDDFSLGRSTLIVDSDLNSGVLAAVGFPEPLADESLANKLGVSETGFLRRLKPGLEIPYTIQTGFGIERQIGGNFTVTADYIFTRGAHLWRESNINAPVLPDGFENFTQYLLSRDFDNRRDTNGVRPITGANADVVRFDLGSNTTSTPGAITTENGVRVATLGLNTQRSANISAALKAIRFLRPDQSLTQVERLESSGNSFYHGASFTLKGRIGKTSRFRVSYTLSKFLDEGTTNTASPQNLDDRRAERALSLQDQRHRLTFSGVIRAPFVKIDLAPIISFGSSRPFNIGAGFDRNLNDISNDRPIMIQPIGRPVWRKPGEPAPDGVKSSLVLAPIGSDGNLPRNYGRGPGARTISLRASRSFQITERVALRASIDSYNPFNNTVFSFGSEFIDRDDADFLIPRRTQRPRIVELNLKFLF
jgi:Carboxypeptidase regulatory-like domain/TonB dependent receptor-like, beta-barrel/TonB-dependent Receptor Plug Domain